MDNLIFVKNTTWPEVFAGWRDREGSDPGWINTATKIKGWQDWESWRRYTAAQFGADKRDWKIYKIAEPAAFIPQMLVGPYTGWQNRLPIKNVMDFAEMLAMPKIYEEFKKNGKITSLLKNWPVKTEFIGVRRADNSRIACIEGHHRATAMALVKFKNQPINFGEATLALAELALGEEKLLDEMLAKGSQKPC